MSPSFEHFLSPVLLLQLAKRAMAAWNVGANTHPMEGMHAKGGSARNIIPNN